MSGLTHASGFEPVYDNNSKVLILGSFPSVKSRAVGFYYGNPQNRFWKMLCGYFGEEIPPDIAGKTAFLLRRKIALWDVVEECDIVGSSDASIRGEAVADVPSLVAGTKAKEILCNGTKSYAVIAERFPQLLPMTKKLPSTSPANPRYDANAWTAALDEVFEKE